jgi:CheY-like chemotaxis protein
MEVAQKMSLAGARILIVEDDRAMTRLLEAAVTAAGGMVTGSASSFASALDLIDTRPVAAVVVALRVKGVRCDEFAAELVRRSIPFAVAAGLDCHRQPQTPRDTQHFQIKYLMALLGSSLRGQGFELPSGLVGEALQLSRIAGRDDRMAG